MAEPRRRRTALAAGLGLLASACNLAPAYHVPVTQVPVAYKEAGPWAAATPLDRTTRGPWWTLFGDPDLSALEGRIERDNPTLAAAVARHDEAVAIVGQARADLFPQASATADVSRNRLAGSRPLGGAPYLYNLYEVGGSASYEVDLWGRVRNGIRAARGDADATLADTANTRLALQADLADAYFRLRGLDTQLDLLRQTVSAYARAYALADTRHTGGVASGLDVSRAQNILSDAKAQISANAAARAAVEHSIAALVGVPASSFSIPYARSQIAPPAVPAGAPSLLLQRRPDIAAAERRVFAANARIGVARAAFFPDLTLGASGGLETVGGASLLSSPAAFWALGPAAAALTLLDGGRRSAQLRQARAVQREQAANYRATVLAAFNQVEDQLSAARLLAEQEVSERDAATAAAKTQDLALTRYRDGASDYLDVVTAQTAALTAESSAIAVRTERLQAAVALVRALGGGFDASAPGGSAAGN
jgi:multidrug efflux system outer membrane protein